MKATFIFLALLFIASPAFSGQDTSAKDGTLIAKEKYAFPSYEQAVDRTDVEKYATKEEYEKAVADRSFEFSKIRYFSDGLKVVAYLYKPTTVTARLPVIVFNRGSFVRGDIAPELVAFFHRLASSGFAVVAPMYRQSDGGEGRDEMGGGDINDLMNLVPLIKSFDFVDQRNVFMYGESRGGIMTYLALRRKFPVNAAAVFGATTDMKRLLDDNPKAYPDAFLSQIWTGYDKNKDSILKDRSAIMWAEEINAPILIMQGGSDSGVKPIHALSFATKLESLNKPYQLIVYAGDDHRLSKNALDRDREAVSWFKAHLQK